MARKSKKELILHTALELFSQKGYHAVTTKEIAEASGVAEGLIFYHFGNKEGLLESVVRSFSFLEQVREQADRWENEPGKEALIQFATFYLTFVHRNKDFLSFIWSPELMHETRANAEVLSLIQGMVEEGGRLIERTAGTSRRAQTAAAMLLSSLLSYALVKGRSGQRTPEEDAQYVREVVEIVLEGVKS